MGKKDKPDKPTVAAFIDHYAHTIASGVSHRKSMNQFYEYCSLFTKAELEVLWNKQLKEMTEAYYKDTDAFPDAFNVVETKGTGQKRTIWYKNVYARRTYILSKAIDGRKRSSKALTDDGDTDNGRVRVQGVSGPEMMMERGDVVINPVMDDPDRLVDKLLSAITKMPDDARRDLFVRLDRWRGENG